MIQVMVVDDEPLSLKELTRLISQDPEFRVVQQATNGAEALEKMKHSPVDVVFLDIEMPGFTGLEVASELARWETPPRVVFATAYDQYAIQAFEANAIDYVLKPFDPERLGKTLERVKSLFPTQKPSGQNLLFLEEDLIQKGVLKKLLGYKRKSKDRILIEPSQVYFFRAQLSEVFAYLEGGELIVRTTLRDLLKTLDPAQFVQTHKAHIVNINKVEKVAPLFSGNFELLFKIPTLPKVPLSRRYASAFKALFPSW